MPPETLDERRQLLLLVRHVVTTLFPPEEPSREWNADTPEQINFYLTDALPWLRALYPRDDPIQVAFDWMQGGLRE